MLECAILEEPSRAHEQIKSLNIPQIATSPPQLLSAQQGVREQKWLKCDVK